MQTVLSGFQTHLGSISSEIKSLQEESLSMNMKIKNRKQTLDEVSDFVDNIALPKDFVM